MGTEKSYQNVRKKLSKEVKRNPKAFYKYLNSKAKLRSGIPTLDKVTGELADNDGHKVEILNQYFNSVFTKENMDKRPFFSQEHLIPLKI